MSMREQMQNVFAAMVKPLRNRVYNIISRAVLEAANDSGKMQVLKIGVLAGENRDDVEYFQDYGFTSRAKAGAECLVVCPQGNREHMIAVKVGDRTVRFKDLGEGEVAVYDDGGNYIHLKTGGTIEVKAATKVDVDAPLVELGDGTLEKILNGETFQARFNAHKHLGNAGVPTGVPIVQSPASDLSNVVKGAK